MADDVRSIVLAGVGGQGVVLASAIVAEALLLAGYDVKQSEVHGMAQRGGSVSSHIRFGDRVESPLVPLGSAEVLAAFEWAEALRWLEFVRPGGAVVADVRRVVPPGACADRRVWLSAYPVVDAAVLRDREMKAHLLDATAVARDLGNVRAANSVVLGALAVFFDVDRTHWEEAIRRLVPRGTEDVNLAAFAAGSEAPAARMDVVPEERGTGFVPATIEVDHAWCKTCDICSRVCPEHCLALEPGGALRIVNPDSCTGCRLCEMLCPDFAITIHHDLAGVGSGASAMREGVTS